MNTNTQAIKERLQALKNQTSNTIEVKKEISTKVEFMDNPIEADNSNPIDLLRQLGNFMQPKSAPINEDRIKELISESLEGIKPTKLEVNYNGKINTIEGAKHFQFEDILKVAGAGLHIWLTGSAGAGKTHTSEMVAKALGLPFYCVSVCSQTTESKLLGYNDANGNYSKQSIKFWWRGTK